MKKLILIFPFILLSAVGFFYWLNLQPVGGSQEKMFVVNRGESSRSIAQRLEKQGLIRNQYVFLAFVRLSNQQGKLQAGSFRLSPRYSVDEVVKTLQSGKVDTWVTFLEGWRKEQFGQEIEAELNLSAQQFVNLSQVQEGYLFPDSYLFPTDYAVEKVANKLTNTFDQNWAELDLSQTDLDKQQIITLASLVEREANTDSSRRIIAGILIKRWQNDWPLQVDATVQYLKGTNNCSINADSCDWWPTVTSSDLKNYDSPFNTYKYKGLPPTPICSPSLSSIQAVINPQQTDYWYYLTGNDGKMYYSETLDEHNQNVDQRLGT
jgi:UPF0755 protein